MSEYIASALRSEVVARAKGCCEYCYSQAKFATQTFAIDHLNPVSAGGVTASENLALSCPGCNGYKSNKLSAIDPVTNEVVPLYHPRLHNWETHFAWSIDFLQIVGITPTGRATVALLKMNRQPLQNLRRVLYEMREHPPE